MTIEEAISELSDNDKVKYFIVQETSSQWQHKLIRVPGGGGSWQETLKNERTARCFILTDKDQAAEETRDTVAEAVQAAKEKLNL